MSQEPARLIVMDDEPEFAAFVRTVATGMGFVVVAPDDADAFKAEVARAEPQAIVLDVVMPQVDGVELVSWLARRKCGAGIVIVSGYDPAYAGAAERIARGYGIERVTTLAKPVPLAALRAALAACLGGDDTKN
jgi:DNA-binding response OmpR family regulator